MGLALEVGILSDLNENDPEGAEHHRTQFENLNRFLATQSLPPHREPESCEVWSCSMYGYSGLHYLRRIAAHLDLEGKLPPPGDRQAAKDPVLARYFEAFERPAASFIGRLFGGGVKKRSFDHLIVHSDAEGYYLPRDFSAVLIPGNDFQIAGGWIGSSQRLIEECRRLAEVLTLPLDIDPEGEELGDPEASQGKSEILWKRYAVESYSCLQLYAAAQHSIKTNAAIVFC